MQQLSSRNDSLVSKGPVQRREGDPILLSHGRQHPNHDPPFGDVDPVGVSACIAQQPFQLISEGHWFPIHAHPRIILQNSQQFGLYA